MPNCKLCRDLVKKADSARLAIGFGPQELIQSESLSDCQACAVILAGIRRFQSTGWHFEDDVARMYLYGESTSQDTISVEIYFKDDRPKLVLEFYRLNDNSDAQSPLKALRVRNMTHGHPLERISWVKQNLKICKHDHKSCSPDFNSILPFRILHLKETGRDVVEVKLMEEKESTTGRYAALSHRWGAHQTCITTMSNVHDRRCGIPWHTIPKTFREAMVYCLKLGIKYIWIDALCIIQDSPKDWQQQSAQMAHIYENSYITLSATTAANDSTGCFGSSPSAPVQCNESLLNKGPPIYVREKLRHWTDFAGASLKKEFPLLTRGWVFQERILSIRTLHFCDRELVWECAETTACECGGFPVNVSSQQQFATRLGYVTQTGLYQSLMGNLTKAKIKKRLSLRIRGSPRPSLFERFEYETNLYRSNVWYRLAASIPGLQAPLAYRSNGAMRFSTPFGQPVDIIIGREHSERPVIPQISGRDLEIWHRIVEKYSSLDLTRMSDRLPALSGLAERIASTSRPYLAGLWKDTLRLDLLWRVDQISEDHRRIPGNLSPTWSWSSVSSGVKYWTREELKNNVFFTRLDAQDQRLFGEVGVSSIEVYRRKQREEQASFRWRPEGFDHDHDHDLDHDLDLEGLLPRRMANQAEIDRLSPELLDWCLLERSCALIPSISHEIIQTGANPFGEVEKGVLEIRGFLREARLKYLKGLSDERHCGLDFDRLQYQLDFATIVGHWRSEHVIHDIRIPFYADYNLWESPPELKVMHDETVYLLEVLVNLFLVLRRTAAGDYQRIGIFRDPMNLDQSYGIDLMMVGEIQDIRLV